MDSSVEDQATRTSFKFTDGKDLVNMLLGKQDDNFKAGNIPKPQEKKDPTVRPELVIKETFSEEESSSLKTSVEDSEAETSELKTSSIHDSSETQIKSNKQFQTDFLKIAHSFMQREESSSSSTEAKNRNSFDALANKGRQNAELKPMKILENTENEISKSLESLQLKVKVPSSDSLIRIKSEINNTHRFGRNDTQEKIKDDNNKSGEVVLKSQAPRKSITETLIAQ